MTTKVQSVTGNGATLTLNGVAAGNALFLIDSYFRNTTTGVGEATPTDTGGTFAVSSADAPIVLSLSDVGVGIFHQQNAASGTHTVTPQANSFHNTTLVEFSGLLTSGLFDVAKSAGTSNFSGTSQVTGTTATTAQADELSLIALGLAANAGTTNVGLTDPVTNYTTLQIGQDDSTTVAAMHAFRILAATGTQTATFNWTDTEVGQTSMACIATFKAVSSTPDINFVQSARGHRGPTSGPRQRRMIPQRYQDDVLITAVPAAIAPFRMGRGRGVGMPMRRMIPQRYPDPVAATNVTVALTGAAATFTAGTLAMIHTQALTGQAATFAAGSVKASLAKALTGSQGIFSAGAVKAATAKALAGQRATFSAGVVSSSLSVPLAGSTVTFGAGTVTPVTGLFIALTGASATFSSGLLTASTQSTQQQFSGGYEYARRSRKRLEEELRRERENWGILPKAAQIIAAIAIRQADELEVDASQRLAELERELDLAGVQYQARYLEVLNLQRQRLIDAEIKGFFEAQEALDEENKRRLLLLLAFL